MQAAAQKLWLAPTSSSSRPLWELHHDLEAEQGAFGEMLQTSETVSFILGFSSLPFFPHKRMHRLMGRRRINTEKAGVQNRLLNFQALCSISVFFFFASSFHWPGVARCV
jgi:hypothetical protein